MTQHAPALRLGAALTATLLIGTALPAQASATSAPTSSSLTSATGPCAEDFRDAPPTSTFYRAITWMACSGLTTGYANGTFGYARPISRGESAVFLYRMSGETFTPGPSGSFSDVPASSYAATAIAWMKARGYALGYADGSFGIDQSITRGELAQLLYRTSQVTDHQPPAVSPFSDVPTSASGYPAVTWLRSTGMVRGYANGTFGYSSAITRGESAQFLYALETHLHGEPEPPAVPPRPAPQPDPEPAPPPSAPQFVVIENDLNLRAGPGVSHRILSVLPRNARVSATGATSAGWRQVTSGSTTGWVNGTYLIADFEAGSAKSAWSATARAVPPTPRNGVSIIRADWVQQPSGYWCGPASLKIVLSAFGLNVTQEEMARQARTTREGTWLHEVGRVMDLHAPAGIRYSVTTIPTANATAAQKRLFRQDMLRTVRAGAPAVVNLAAAPAEQPAHYPRGATLYHHFVVVGYDETTDRVLVYDPWNYGGVRQFWLPADQVADMAGLRGYVSIR